MQKLLNLIINIANNIGAKGQKDIIDTNNGIPPDIGRLMIKISGDGRGKWLDDASVHNPRDQPQRPTPQILIMA